jgi:hypothetical protein
VTLNLLVPSLDDAPVTSHMLSTAMTHALDTELHAHMKQQREAQQQEEGVGAEEGVPRSPFSNSAAAAGGGPTGGSPFSGTGPAPAAGHVAPAGGYTCIVHLYNTLGWLWCEEAHAASTVQCL